MTQRTQNNVTWTQTFDAENRLVTVAGGGTTTTYVYDGSGSRVKRIVNDGSSTVTTIYVAGMEIELHGSTEDHRTIYYAAGGAFRVVGGTNAGLYYRHGDHLGSTSVLSDVSGNKVANSDVVFAPYGEVRVGELSTLTDFGFTGQRLDRSTDGLMYYGARYYLPGLNRFISADTIVPHPAKPQSYNRYSYVQNNPVKYIDPTGHMEINENYDSWCLDHPWLCRGGDGEDKPKDDEEPDPVIVLEPTPQPDDCSALESQLNPRCRVETKGGKGRRYHSVETGLPPGYEPSLATNWNNVVVAGQIIQSPDTPLWAKYVALNYEVAMGSAHAALAKGSAILAGAAAIEGWQLLTGGGTYCATSTTCQNTVAKGATSAIGSIEDVFKNPALLEGRSLEEVQRSVGNPPEGWVAGTLDQGSHAGGGWTLHELAADAQNFTDRYLQYHPGTLRHYAGDAYWKVSSAINGIQRFLAGK